MYLIHLVCIQSSESHGYIQHQKDFHVGRGTTKGWSIWSNTTIMPCKSNLVFFGFITMNTTNVITPT
jgi:hypothetical protein